MLKKIGRGMEKWGHYLLAMLCAGVIALSAVWTREQQAGETADQAALSDQSQRMAQVTQEPDVFVRPLSGAVIGAYSETPVFFLETGVWQSHPALDFFAEEGDRVFALAAGTVTACGEGEVRITHGNGRESLYRGIKEIAVRPGQQVKAGAALGTAGERVPYEGAGRVCVMLLQDQVPCEFGQAWTQ